MLTNAKTTPVIMCLSIIFARLIRANSNVKHNFTSVNHIEEIFK